jgi:putative transposase
MANHETVLDILQDRHPRTADLERENSHLKKAIAELTVDKLILKEALEGNY